MKKGRRHYPIAAKAYRLAFGADSTLPAVFKRTIAQFLDEYSERMEEVTTPPWQGAYGHLATVPDRPRG